MVGNKIALQGKVSSLTNNEFGKKFHSTNDFMNLEFGKMSI